MARAAVTGEDPMHEYAKLVAFLPLLFLCVPADAMAQAAGGDSGSVRQPPTQVAPVMRELAVLAPATPVEIATQPVTVTLAIPSSARPRMAVASAAPAVRPTL